MRFNLKFRSGPSLCHTCRYSHVFTPLGSAREHIHCDRPGQMHSINMGAGATECNQHLSTNAMSEWEAKERGWILEVKGGKIIGFKPPRKKEDPE